MEFAAMTQRMETIEAIRKLNPSASSEFLATFNDDELSRYLVRLSDIHCGPLTSALDSARFDGCAVRRDAAGTSDRRIPSRAPVIV
jgi:hypothetical protein